ncbi:hypothetical protein MLD38_031080 [Melastoma candidum]|uniref:Uncharacterized protein n=1 Tax=Melastoma candidum TaxID=119954 RepID=A0ACB9MN87_9MYRT|nr:hypothetical protein MLD38_031080 [Melastoma candidum]
MLYLEGFLGLILRECLRSHWHLLSQFSKLSLTVFYTHEKGAYICVPTPSTMLRLSETTVCVFPSSYIIAFNMFFRVYLLHVVPRLHPRTSPLPVFHRHSRYRL